MTGEIEGRKIQHIDTVLGEDVSAKGIGTGFDAYAFDHVALPECNLDEIDLSCRVLGRDLRAPLIISSMTGGASRAREINRNLAATAQQLGIAMGLGSQRAALLDPKLADTYRVRDVAPDIALFANFGAVQLANGFGLDEARRAVEMIDADALILHLNPLQEAVQAEGDRDWSGIAGRIADLCAAIDIPVIVKEVGNGISGRVARQLIDCGVGGIDVAGAGGTSWSEVEAYRQTDPMVRAIAHSFAGWGIPTARALGLVRGAAPHMPVIASGGIRSGIDAAMAVRLGASLVGIAAPALAGAVESADAVQEFFERIIAEFRIASFCTGSATLAALRQADFHTRSDGKAVPPVLNVPQLMARGPAGSG